MGLVVRNSSGTNCDSKKVTVLNLTDKHRDMFHLFEAICCHPSYKQTSLPKFLKTNILNVSPGLYIKIYKPHIQVSEASCRLQGAVFS
jgi:hypothetical protein